MNEEFGELYLAIGGEAVITKIVDAFYAGVATDPILRPLYPDEDLGDANWRLRMFLVQYWGGPSTYSEERGHPRLRMRHVPFRITTVERDAWLGHMTAAIESVAEQTAMPESMRARFIDYVTMAADSLVNTDR